MDKYKVINGIGNIVNYTNVIEAYAFKDNQDLIVIDIPDGVYVIADNSFKNCRHLKKVTLPDSIVYIAPSAFEGCIELESLILPNKLEIIPSRMAVDCNRLKNIYIPKSVKEIQNSALYNCRSLEYLGFEDNYTLQIKSYAVMNCVNLKMVSFKSCFDVIIDTNSFPWCNIEALFLNDCLNLTIKRHAFYCSDLAGFFATDSQIIIDHKAFSDQENLQTIRFNNCIVDIGSYAFKNCTKLETIDLRKCNLTIGYRAITKSNSSLKAIYVDHIYEEVLKRNLPLCFHDKIIVS